MFHSYVNVYQRVIVWNCFCCCGDWWRLQDPLCTEGVFSKCPSIRKAIHGELSHTSFNHIQSILWVVQCSKPPVFANPRIAVFFLMIRYIQWLHPILPPVSMIQMVSAWLKLTGAHHQSLPSRSADFCAKRSIMGTYQSSDQRQITWGFCFTFAIRPP